MASVFDISILIIIFFGIYMFAFAISVGGVIYVYTTEIVPSKVLMIPSLVQAILTVLIGSFTLKLIDLVGIYSMYTAFGGFAMLGWFLFEGLAIETQGKQNSQIIREFKNKGFMK